MWLSWFVCERKMWNENLNWISEMKCNSDTVYFVQELCQIDHGSFSTIDNSILIDLFFIFMRDIQSCTIWLIWELEMNIS